MSMLGKSVTQAQQFGDLFLAALWVCDFLGYLKMAILVCLPFLAYLRGH
jgi:hypothetical protein